MEGSVLNFPRGRGYRRPYAGRKVAPARIFPDSVHLRDPATEFIYRIDATDRIIFANEAFLRFARENLRADATEAHFVGHPLWHFIQDKSTRAVMHSLIDKVRKTGQPIEVPFRCDSATRRRFCGFRMTPLPEGGLKFTSWIAREEERERVALFDPGIERVGSAHLPVCSWCKRIPVGSHWLEVEDAVRELNLFHETMLPELTHGICPTCAQSLTEERSE